MHKTPANSPFVSVNVGDVPFRVATIESASAWLLLEAAPSRLAINVRLANAYNVALAGTDSAYGDLLRTEGVNFPDGTPVVWFMKLAKAGRNASRVRGPSFFMHVLRTSGATRHFFLGGSPDTLNGLEANLRQQIPGLVVAGTYSPPFAPVTEALVQDCVARIAATGADIVWVGLGTPKQDWVGTSLAKALSMPTVNVGAAFDFAAGTVREAPAFVQNNGLEWLFRLFSEPRRLWRRYLIGNIQFLGMAILGLTRAQINATEEGGPR